MTSNTWIVRADKPGEFHSYSTKENLLTQRTRFQLVEIVQSVEFGKILMLDNIIQSSEIDEFIYHESIVHPVLCAHPSPKNVLIIGGGEGATLREVLKHSCVEAVTMVDIDGELVGISKNHLNSWHKGAFDDPRCKLIIEDGRVFLESTTDRFDCIILDLTDPFEGGNSQKLFTLEFFKIVANSLRIESGLMSLQARNAAFGLSKEHCILINTLKAVFKNVFPYYANVPIFAPDYGFAICSDNNLGLNSLTSISIDEVLANREVADLRFYDSITANRMFSIPKTIRTNLASMSDYTVTDSNPVR